jgi:uncharacterized protein
MTHKLSYYTIFSDPVNSQHDVILFCSRTGQAVKVSQRTQQLLETGKFDELEPRLHEKLVAVKALVPADERELSSIVGDNRDTIDHETTLYEVIQPTAMCQLGCDYCGQEHSKHNLATALYSKLTERIERKLSTGNFTSLFIGWFGAEPLMGLRQIRELTALFKGIADSRQISYSAKVVSNGLSLKPNIFEELAQDLNVRQIEITLDGTGDFHDQRRHTKEKTATFDLIFNNILDIVNLPDFSKLNCRISIRCNVDHRNVEGVSPLINLMARHGLQNKIAYFYPIGVYSWGGNEAHKKSLTKEEFAELEIGWMMEMLEKGFIPHLIPNRVKKICMAVSPNSEMYDAFGNIFKCTEVSYSSNPQNKAYTLGHLGLDNSYVEKDHPLQHWYQDIEAGQFPCSTCKMLPVCGGGCPKSWHEDMRACPTAKFNIKERLALSYVAAYTDLKEPEFA